MNSNRVDGDNVGGAMGTSSSSTGSSMGSSTTGAGSGMDSGTAASGSGANVARGMSGDTNAPSESSGGLGAGLSADRLREQTQQASEWARQQATQLSSRASEFGDQAGRWADDARVTAQQRLDDLSTRVREKPIGAVAAAAGIGLVIGLLLGR